ncbi:MAG: PilZ domain-containing protein [Candidatus Omnitrophota bacterium]
MASPDGSERRRYPRLSENFFVSYKTAQGSNISRTKNISRGGMMLTLGTFVPIGTRMAFSIRGPFTPEAIEVMGTILECREIMKGSVYETRVQFSETSISSLAKLDEFIKKRLGTK